MSVVQNIYIYQYSDFSENFHLANSDDEDYEGTGITGTSQMRKNWESTTAVDFTVVIVPGTLTLSLTADETADLEPGRYVYDVLFRNSSNVVTRIVEGVATVVPGATRP